MRRAFRIAYDGRPFHGFQRQPDVPTVEESLFTGLEDLEVLTSNESPPPGYSAAGRTDAGVSAVAQTVALDCPEWLTPRAFNGGLPETILAWAASDVDPTFHATRDAHRREYTYQLYAPKLADDRVKSGCDRLSGEHDFRHLTPDEHRTERKIEAHINRDGDYLVITISSGGFPRQLVRRLVSLLRAIGSGEERLSVIDRILDADSSEASFRIPPAPPEPLVLTAVDYDRSFEVDAKAAGRARGLFEDRRVEQTTLARVSGTILERIG